MKLTCRFYRLCLAAGLVAWAAPAAFAAAAAKGSIRFEDSAIDFGEVYRGQILTHQFRFTNTGSGPVTIQGVHAACGCTAAEVDRGHQYKPGESGVVEIRLDTTEFAGTVVKAVTVMSDERPNPDRTLTLRARVKSEVESDPPLLDFGDVLSREGAARTVQIKPIGGFALAVQDVTYNRDLVSVVQRPAADGGVVLDVRLKDGLAPGFVKDTVLVKTNSRHLQSLPIPVRANVKGNVDISPSYIEFGAIGPQTLSRRAVTLKGGEALEITGTRMELIINGRRVENAADLLKIETVPHERGRRLVSVELRNGGDQSGSVHGKLWLLTSDAAQKEIAVDFYAFFR